MSGRIRTIKPELLEDEKTASLSDLEFRLFVALILLADDYGNLRGEPGFINGTALWATDHDNEAAGAGIDRLCEVGLLRPYAVRGQRYLHLSGWSKHQRVDKPGKPRVPGPDDPETVLPREWKTYFVRLGSDGPIKIGKATDVARRIAEFQTTAPAKLEILLVIDRNSEAELHRRFKDLREHGEWFRPEPELLDFIKKERLRNDSGTIPELAANDSGLISDLRSPISERDLPRARPRRDESGEETLPPPTIEITDDMRAQCAIAGAHEPTPGDVVNMLAYAREKGLRRNDWSAALVRWMVKGKQYDKRDACPPPSRKPLKLPPRGAANG